VIGVHLLGCRSIGLIFDGWGKRIDGASYFAIMACSDADRVSETKRLPPALLSFAPFLDEENHSADEQLGFIEVR